MLNLNKFIMENTSTNLSNLKPLDEYLKDLKSRNVHFAELIPDLHRTVLNVSSYDELYKKLIEESYYICNELAKGSNHKMSNPPTEREKEDLSKNINRALIFQSNENLNIGNIIKKEQELLSPIVKLQDDNKSYFYSTSNRFNNTEVKEKNNEVIQNINTLNPLPNFNTLTANKFKDSKIKEPDFEKTKNISSFKIAKNTNNLYNNNTNNNFQGSTNSVFPREDILFLINNMKEIEKTIEKENPVKLINDFENKISSKLTKFEDILNEEIIIVEDKKELEKNINDLNILYNQFGNKFDKLEEMLELVKNTNNCVTLNSNNNSINHQIKNSYLQKDNNNNITSENEERTNDKTNYFGYNTNSNSNNEISSNQYKIIPCKYSQQINNLFANSQMREATELWRKFDYDIFEGTTLERSYEMLSYITKLKDREIEILNSRIINYGPQLQEMKKKDGEIVSLFAELETYKNMSKMSNSKDEENKKLEFKINNVMKENNLIYKENVKLKMIMQQEKYLSTRNTQSKLFS